MKDEHETVVVDFKFGKPKPEYHDQIKGYVKAQQVWATLMSRDTSGMFIRTK